MIVYPFLGVRDVLITDSRNFYYATDEPGHNDRAARLSVSTGSLDSLVLDHG